MSNFAPAQGFGSPSMVTVVITADTLKIEKRLNSAEIVAFLSVEFIKTEQGNYRVASRVWNTEKQILEVQCN